MPYVSRGSDAKSTCERIFKSLDSNHKIKGQVTKEMHNIYTSSVLSIDPSCPIRYQITTYHDLIRVSILTFSVIVQINLSGFNKKDLFPYDTFYMHS